MTERNRREWSGIITGHHETEKKERAYQFRREMTPVEAVLWQELRRSQLGGLHFRRQQIIDGFIADFYCHAAGLVVELDGAVHEGKDRKEYDAERDKAFQRRGLRTLRVPNQRVHTELKTVLAEIEAAAKERIQHLASPDRQNPPTRSTADSSPLAPPSLRAQRAHEGRGPGG